MPEQPSLEDLARAAVEAWRKWCDADLDYAYASTEFADVAAALVALETRLEATPGAYMTPGERVQVELRFACALLAGHEWPICDNEWRAVIDRARKMARLLLDGPDKERPHA